MRYTEYGIIVHNGKLYGYAVDFMECFIGDFFEAEDGYICLDWNTGTYKTLWNEYIG